MKATLTAMLGWVDARFPLTKTRYSDHSCKKRESVQNLGIAGMVLRSRKPGDFRLS